MIGEGSSDEKFCRGISQYPTVDDPVHLVAEADLVRIYGQRGKQNHLVKVGHIAGSQSIDALIDVNKLITRHSAIVGTTGTGKSTTVASLVRALSSSIKYPAARIIILDVHGEYSRAFGERANAYQVNADGLSNANNSLQLPFWAMEFAELMELTFGNFPDDSKAKNIIMERIIEAKVQALEINGITDVDPSLINADSSSPL